MSKEERKLKAKVDEYFEKYMCVSFDKFIENWEDLERYSKEQDKILQQKENIIKEAIKYNEQLLKIYDCGVEKDNAETNILILKGALEILDKGE